MNLDISRKVYEAHLCAQEPSTCVLLVVDFHLGSTVFLKSVRATFSTFVHSRS